MKRLRHFMPPLITAVALWACTSSEQHCLTGLKLVTIGDSQTALLGWQPTLIALTGMSWSAEETTMGLNGHLPTAKGGSWMKPIETNSIYFLGHDAPYYQPDVIILYAGQNDVLSSWLSEDNTGDTPLACVEQEPVYSRLAVDASVSTVSAFKGLIEYLLAECPKAHLYLMTHVPILGAVGMNPTGEFAQWYPSPRFATAQDVIDFEHTEHEPKDDLIRALATYYNLTVIDNYTSSGIIYSNVASYYDEVAGDCTQVHLNALGDSLIGLCAASTLLNDPTW